MFTLRIKDMVIKVQNLVFFFFCQQKSYKILYFIFTLKLKISSLYEMFFFMTLYLPKSKHKILVYLSINIYNIFRLLL